MSPSCGVGVFEAGFPELQREAAIESLIQLDFGTCEGKAPVLVRDLEAAALPLHDVVVANDAFMPERADTFELLGSRAPGFGGAATFEPVVRAAIELQEFAFARGAQTALAMSGSAAFAGRAKAFLAQQAAQSLTSQGEAFDFTEFFAEMVVVEAGVLGASQGLLGAAHAKSPLMQVLITLTRCSSF